MSDQNKSFQQSSLPASGVSQTLNEKTGLSDMIQHIKIVQKKETDKILKKRAKSQSKAAQKKSVNRLSRNPNLQMDQSQSIDRSNVSQSQSQAKSKGHVPWNDSILLDDIAPPVDYSPQVTNNQKLPTKKIKAKKVKGFTPAKLNGTAKAQDFLAKNRIMSYQALKPLSRTQNKSNPRSNGPTQKPQITPFQMHFQSQAVPYIENDNFSKSLNDRSFNQSNSPDRLLTLPAAPTGTIPSPDTTNSQSKVVIQRVEVEVPIESVKIQTVEKIVEVPIETIKYVDRIVTVDNQETISDLQYKLQESIKSKVKQSQEDRIIIREQQNEILRLNQQIQEQERLFKEKEEAEKKIEVIREELNENSSEDRQKEGNQGSSKVKEIVKEVVVEKPVEVIKEVVMEKPVEVIKEVIVEKPVQVIKEVIVEKPVEVIKKVEVEKLIEVIKEVVVEKPVEVVKEVIKEKPVEVIKEVEVPVIIEKIVTKHDEEYQKQLQKETDELKETLKKVQADNSEIIYSHQVARKASTAKDQEIESLKTQIYEKKQYFEENLSRLRQELQDDQTKFENDIKELKSQNSNQLQEHQGQIQEMKKQSWWMSALQLRVKKALVAEIETQRKSIELMHQELQQRDSRNEALLEKIQKKETSSQEALMLKLENQSLKDQLRKQELLVEQLKSQTSQVMATENEQVTQLESLKNSLQTQLKLKEQQIERLERVQYKLSHQHEKEIEDKTKAIKKALDHLEKQENLIQEQTKEIKQYQKDLNDAESLQKELLEAKKSVELKENYNKELKEAQDNNKASLEESQSQLAEQADKFEKLKQECEQEVNKKNDLQTKLDKLDGLYQLALKNLKQLQTKSNSLTDQTQSKQQEAEVQILEAQTESQALLKKVEDLESQLKDANDKTKEMKDLEEIHKIAEASLAQAQENAKSEQSKVDALESQLKNANDKIQKLKQEQEKQEALKNEAKKIEKLIEQVNQKADQGTKTKEQEIDHLKKQLVANQQNHQEIITKLKEKSKCEQDQLKGELGAAKTKNWWMAALHKRVKGQLMQQLSEMSNKEQELVKASMQEGRLKQQMQQVINQMKEEIQSQSKQISQYKDTLQQSKQSHQINNNLQQSQEQNKQPDIQNNQIQESPAQPPQNESKPAIQSHVSPITKVDDVLEPQELNQEKAATPVVEPTAVMYTYLNQADESNPKDIEEMLDQLNQEPEEDQKIDDLKEAEVSDFQIQEQPQLNLTQNSINNDQLPPFDLKDEQKDLSKTLPSDLSSQKSEKKKESLKMAKTTLKQQLKKYMKKVSFQKDLDQMWNEADDDGNGWLDQEEAKKFILEVSKVIDQERAKNFDINEFPKLFEKYDEDGNGFLSKGEMAQFIKLTFKSSKQSEYTESESQSQRLDDSFISLPSDLSSQKSEKKKEQLKNAETTLKQYLKKYMKKVSFQKDLDQMWQEADDDGNGWLNQEEAKKFILEVSKVIDQERAKNFDINEFPKLFKKYDEDGNGFLSKGEMAQFIKLTFKSSKQSEYTESESQSQKLDESLLSNLDVREDLSDANKSFSQDNQSSLFSYTEDSQQIPNIQGEQRGHSKTLQPESKKDKLIKQSSIKQVKFKDYFRRSKLKFGKDLDKIWDEANVNGNQCLDREESKAFIIEVSKVINADKAKNFEIEKFPQLYEQFDQDKNGVLSKGEMAQFIKTVFRDEDKSESKSSVDNTISELEERNDLSQDDHGNKDLKMGDQGGDKDQIQFKMDDKLSKTLDPKSNEQSPTKSNKSRKSFDFYLKSYMQNVKFSRNLDEIWDENDKSNNENLTKDEAKSFILEVKKVIQQDRAQNFKIDKFEELFKQFDEDKNGTMSKAEMSQFIKFVFKSSS